MFRSTVLAATRPQDNISTITVSAALGTIIVSLLLVLLLRGIGRRIPGFSKIDDVLRILIAFFGITGAIVSIPKVRGFRDGLHDLIVSGATEGGGHNTAVTVITVIIAAIVTWMYYSRGSFGNLIWFVIFTLPLTLNDTLLRASVFCIEHIGHPLFEGLSGAVQRLLQN